MRATPKLDAIVARLQYAANVFSFMSYYVDRIDTNEEDYMKGLPDNMHIPPEVAHNYGEGYAKEVLSGLKQAWEVNRRIVITPKEVEKELLGTCPDIDDIIKCIAVVGTKFNQVGLPVDIDSYVDMKNENMQRLNNINQIPVTIRNDITLYLHLWGDYCQMWVMAVKNIISNLSEYVENYKKVLTGNIIPDKPQQVQASTCKTTFKDKIIAENKDEVLNKLHSMIDGKRGKNVALVIFASVEIGLILKPTYTEVKNEFGNVVAESGYNNYLDKSKFSDSEINGIKNRLLE